MFAPPPPSWSTVITFPYLQYWFHTRLLCLHKVKDCIILVKGTTRFFPFSYPKFVLYWREFLRDFFNLYFCHNSNPSKPRIKRPKYFRIPFPFRQDIQSLISKILNSDFAVCMTPRSKNCTVVYRPSETPFFILQIFYFMTAVFTNKIMFSDWPFNIKQRSEKLSILTLRCDTTVGCASQSFWFLFKPISKIFYPVFWGPYGFYSWHK